MRAVLPAGPDAVNRPVWASADAVGDFATAEGWTDPGERAAVLSIASSVRGEPMLDLGMGGGRSTTWSRLLTDDYVGVDITPELVAAARARHPGVAFATGDARDLSAFPDGRFGFVMFSFNGIDAVGHDDRAVVLREVGRVLRPGGQVLISTDNLDAACYRTTPFHRRKATPDAAASPGATPGPHATRDRVDVLAHRLIRLAADPLLPLRRAGSWRRLRRQGEDHGSWAMAPLDAYAFGLLVHWTTLSAACTEFEAAGLTVTRVFRSDTGAPVDPADWHRPRAVTCDYLHLVAERSTPAD